MRSMIRALATLTSAACLIAPSTAQTYTNCNPTIRTDCPADSALARTVNIDLSSASDSFTPQSNPTYGKDGVSFTISKSGDAPQLTSKWYIMFGKVDVVLKAAPGAGIVSSFVMQSDTLDEIDWEWLGSDPDEVQTNFFGKGQTTSYNRGAFHADAGSQSGFKTYTIEWTPQQIVWQIDGVTVRTLEPANAENQYPQTPMQIKFGAWAGGDPSNAAGTIEWSRGPTDYSKGPFTMQVKSLKVADYSTGSTYTYGDTSGTWKSIKSNGGVIYSGGDRPVNSDSPQITATATGAPLPFTPSRTSSDYERPSVYPWIPNSSSATPEPTFGNYPGLPSGWTVSDSGKVLPPSSAPVSKPSVHLPNSMGFFANNEQQASPLASSTASPVASQSASSGDSKSLTQTGYDDRGFTTIYTSYPGTTQAASQPTSTAKQSANLLLENNAAETALPVPKANVGFTLPAKPAMYICSFLAAAMAASYIW